VPKQLNTTSFTHTIVGRTTNLKGWWADQECLIKFFSFGRLVKNS